MSGSLVQVLKKLSKETIEAEHPCNIVFGTVTNEEPLEITIDQKLVLTQEFLVLSRNVTEFEIEMTVDHITEKSVGGSGYAMYSSHDHQYKGRKKFLVHNQLKQGEKVIMAMVHGGQQYIVIDRVG
mgnify:CR=1 FL=1